jgi:hypothetical protein
MINKEPNWQRLCSDTAINNWDCDKGCAISRDLWWTAKLFYGKVVTKESCWLTPFVSPGSASVHFSWNYGYRRLNLEITEGLWFISEKDGSWHQTDDLLPEEALAKIQAFYRKCLIDKRRQFIGH